MKRNCLLLMLILALISCKNKTLFKRVDSTYSGIQFNNAVAENDTLNPLDVTNIYNGGGVGIADFNNDGLQDIYFTGNTVSNKVNQGPRVGQNDSIGDPVFSDIGFFSGIAETDWSWAPVVTDFNNDGYRDLIVTNGFPKDITDHDFMVFRNEAYQIASKEMLLQQIPEVKLQYLNGIPPLKLNRRKHKTIIALTNFQCKYQ